MGNPVTFFAKSESGIAPATYSFYNYAVGGTKIASPNIGSVELAAGFKLNNSGSGPYTDCRIATPEFGKTGIKFECRERAQLKYSKDKKKDFLFNQSAYLRYQRSINDGGSIYCYGGVDAEIKNGYCSSVSPFGIAGYSHNIKARSGVYSPYIEVFGNKPFITTNQEWSKSSFGISAGVKYSF